MGMDVHTLPDEGINVFLNEASGLSADITADITDVLKNKFSYDIHPEFIETDFSSREFDLDGLNTNYYQIPEEPVPPPPPEGDPNKVCLDFKILPDNLTLKFKASLAKNDVIDWGDSTTTTLTAASAPSHVYTKAGNYCVQIQTTLTAFGFNKAATDVNDQLIGITSFGNKVATITANAFVGCPNLSYVRGPKTGKNTTLKTFTAGWIDQNNNITELDLRNHTAITTIGSSVFLMMPNLTELGEGAFSGCTALTTLDLANSYIQTVKAGAFENCTKLNNVSLFIIGKQNTVSYIGPRAFSNTALVSFANAAGTGNFSFGKVQQLPNNHKVEIDDNAFIDCPTLKNVAKQAFYMSEFLKDCKFLPDSITTLAESAFDGALSISCLVIPNSITTAGKYAFNSCVSLRKIEFRNKDLMDSNSVTIFNTDHMFYNCPELKSIVFPNYIKNFTVAADKSFIAACPSLTSIYIPDSVCSLSSTMLFDKLATSDYNGLRLKSIRLPYLSRMRKDKVGTATTVLGYLFNYFTTKPTAANTPSSEYFYTIKQIYSAVNSASISAFIPYSWQILSVGYVADVPQGSMSNISSLTEIHFEHGDKLKTTGSRYVQGCTNLSGIYLHGIKKVEDVPQNIIDTTTDCGFSTDFTDPDKCVLKLPDLEESST